MFSSIFCKLFWKEFRTFWPAWVAIFSLAVSLLVLAFSYNRSGIGLESLLVSSMLLTALYAVGCSGSTFAWELESGTFGRLRSLPVASWQVAAAKFTWSVTSSIALFLAIGLFGAPFCSGWESAGDEFAKFLIISVPVIAETLVWGTLFSTLTRQPMLAIVYAVMAFFCYNAAWIAVVNISLKHTLFSYIWGYTTIRVLVFLPIVGLTAYRATHWFACCRKRESRRSLGDILDLDTFFGNYDHYFMMDRPFVALLKQYWHQNRSLFRVLLLSFLAAAGFLIFYRFTSEGLSDGKKVAFIALIPWLGAICTIVASNMFGGDQRQEGFRFFAHRSISPRMVWASRLLLTGILFWGFWTCTFAIVGLYYLPDMVQALEPKVVWHYTLYSLYTFFAAGFLIFASGAICSMLFRSRLVAWAGSMCIVFLCESVSYYAAGHQHVNIFIFLPAIGLLLGSYLYASDWVREQSTRQAHFGWLVPSVLSLLLFIVISRTAYPPPPVKNGPMENIKTGLQAARTGDVSLLHAGHESKEP